jgi:hypothetical protein
MPDGKQAAGVPVLLQRTAAFCGVPPLPDRYVPRPEAERALRAAVLDCAEGQSLAITPTASISGTAGLGKTTCAIWLAHDPRVQSRFADAVVWLPFGQDALALDRLRALAARLGLRDDLRDERDALEKLEPLLRGKRCLVILDDCWHDAQVKPFKHLRVVLLVTTRLLQLAEAHGDAHP